MKVLRAVGVAGLVIVAVVVLALEPGAGPVGVSRAAMGKMFLARNGSFYGKVPLMVEGDQAVTVSVPPRLRGRVFLYYGHLVGRDGKPTTSFFEARGYGETEFRPCTSKPRTIWPGGLRIKGSAPVHLLVRTGNGASLALRLGRPAAP
jgi:hypothetical protein